MSDLINIKNTNGDEEFTKSGNSLVWDADGADIYYQGESQKALPIECNVKYELDGKEIEPKDLAGKSGKVKIIIEYTNKDEHIVNIQGKNTKLYTPFVVVCGTILDNEIHKNIEVSNGKIVNDGNKTFVLGMAFPGLRESLDISSDKVDFPDTVEITMESTKFEMSNIASFITPKVLEEEDLSIFDDLDEVYDKVNTLESSSKQLEDGANTLKSGIDTFYEKSQEFNSAMKDVSKGANTIYKSYTELDDGINTLHDGTTELKDGAKKLSDGSKDLKDGAKKLEDGASSINSNLKTASTKAKELSVGAESLSSGLTSINSLMPSVANCLDINKLQGTKNAIDKQITDLESQINALISSQNRINVSMEILQEEVEDVVSDSQVKKEVTPSIDLSETIAESEKIINALKQTSAIYQSLINRIQTSGDTDKLTESISKLAEGADTLSQGTQALSTGLSQISAGAGELSSGAKELYDGTKDLVDGANDLYDGTETLADGAKALSDGSKEMKDGLKTLDNGATELANANDQLTDGAETISDGAKELTEGVSRFNKEGIEKVCSYINGDVKKATERLEKLKDLANEYKTFTMLNDSTEGSVKFIMIMDGITVKDAQKEEIILNQDKENKNDNK